MTIATMNRHRRSKTLAIQPRDFSLLEQLSKLRFLSAGQIQRLLFPESSLSATCRRLRRLVEHGLLSQARLPLIIGTGPMRAGTRLFSLAPGGAAMLARQRGKSISPSAPNPFAPTVQHDLIGIEVLVSLLVEMRVLGRTLEDWCDDRELHRRLHHYRSGAKRRTRMPIPDASFTLAGQTFHLEVLRAPARGGNKGIREKLKRYVKLVHNRKLQTAYGHQRIRSILLATATQQRAESLRSIVTDLKKGRQLFWVGRYHQESALHASWMNADGQELSIANAAGL